MRRGTLTRLVVLAAATLPADAQFLSINELSGQVGNLAVGRSISEYGRELVRLSFDVYTTRDFAIAACLDSTSDAIREIRACKLGMYTKRFVVIGNSTMEDVLKRYGQAQLRRQEYGHSALPDRMRGSKIVLSYNTFAFTFDNSPDNKTEPMSRRVECVLVRDPMRPFIQHR